MFRKHTTGFTLIELMIAIGLGAMILVVAMAGLRVTAQALSAANRMSFENSLMRAAVTAANVEMDFWNTFDALDPGGVRPLRSRAQPFFPLSFKGTDPDLNFNHSDGRQWWNGQIWSCNNLRWGDYSLYGGQAQRFDTSPLVPPERNWRHRILPHITNNLGYMAAADYLPANFIFGYYAGGTSTGGGRIPNEFSVPRAGYQSFLTPWRSRAQPRSKCETAHDSGFMLTTVAEPTLHPQCHRAVFSNYYGGLAGGDPNWHVAKLRNWKNYPLIDFLTQGPSHWPSVNLRTRVALNFTSFIHETQIVMNNRLSGETVTLVLKGLTTTLRGARRQRELDAEDSDPQYP